MTTVKVFEHNADGSVTESSFEMSPELEEKLNKARVEWQRLKESGTPYWCTHEGRSVTHPSAYWWKDHPRHAIYRKHGVRCKDCGGYIQEG